MIPMTYQTMYFRKDASSSNNRIHSVIFVSLWIFVIGSMVYNKIQYTRTVRILTQKLPAIFHRTNARSLTTFVIYPRVVKAVGQPVVMTLPDPLIDEFFAALKDARSYARSGVTVASWDHEWLVKMTIGNERLQMKCYIPSKEDNLVVGEFLGSKGAFQSHNLFYWYQKYNDRWLNPDEAHPPEHAEDEDGDLP